MHALVFSSVVSWLEVPPPDVVVVVIAAAAGCACPGIGYGGPAWRDPL